MDFYRKDVWSPFRGAVMLVIPLIITITENSIRIFVPMISLLLLLFGFPIIVSSKKNKNIEN